jgi:ribonuclease H2 subunit B
VTSVQLTHPSTGTPAAFLLPKAGDGGAVTELNVFRPAFAAWLTGEAAVGDGGLWVATPVDPLLLLIPALERARAATPGRPEGVFVDLANALLDDPTCPALHRLLPLVLSNGKHTSFTHPHDNLFTATPTLPQTSFQHP